MPTFYFLCIKFKYFSIFIDNIFIQPYNIYQMGAATILPSSRKRIERKLTLIQVLQKCDSIPIDELAHQTGVSSSTLRRELRDLVNENLVAVNVGKVSLATPSNEEKPFAMRSLLNSDEKVRIGAAALGLIRNGDTIFIAGGTTTLELARLLLGQRRLTVITNALRVVDLLVDQPGIDLVILGGAVRPGEQTLHGHLTDWGVAQFRADKLFYGIEAISLQHGLTHSQIVEVSTDRALASAATQTIVLADHTKFGKVASALVMPLENVHVVITGRDLPADTLEGLRAKGLQVILA
jgi:DeoR family transcriptional regulator, aga operon transcriptional repressor